MTEVVADGVDDASPVRIGLAGPVFGVILAGGSSSRLGRPKQLLPLGGRPLLAHTLDGAARSALDGIVVVLGHEADAIRGAIDFDAIGARVVLNSRYRDGQSTSLRAGLMAVPRTAAAAVFLLGDQPLIGPAILDALIAAYRESGARIVMPAYDGRRGNPVLFDRALWPALLRIEGDQGARGVIRGHAAEVIDVPIAGGHLTDDIDTEEDYERLRARFEQGAAAE